MSEVGNHGVGFLESGVGGLKSYKVEGIRERENKGVGGLESGVRKTWRPEVSTSSPPLTGGVGGGCTLTLAGMLKEE